MKSLLDTCLISELVKPDPSIAVLDWLQAQDECDLYLSVLTLGELAKGIEKLPDSRRRRDLREWLDRELKPRFHGRWLPIDLRVAALWGSLLAQAERSGRPLPAIDALLAATAINSDLTLVTRNVADFASTGVALHNPWKDA